MTIGERIKLIRGFRRLTQKQLGQMSGIHEVAIRKYELGKVIPKQEQLEKIADALQITINSLMDIKVATDSDIFPLLFAIDEVVNIDIVDVEGKPAIQFDHENMDRFLRDWRSMKEMMAAGVQLEDNYTLWKILRPGYTKVVTEEGETFISQEERRQI